MILASRWSNVGLKSGFNVINESSFPPWYQKTRPKFVKKHSFKQNFEALTDGPNTRIAIAGQRCDKSTKNFKVSFTINHS